MFARMYVCALHVYSPWEGQKKVSYTLDLEL